MTVALEGGEWSAARPGRTLPLGKTRYPFYRRLGGPQGRSGRVGNGDGVGGNCCVITLTVVLMIVAVVMVLVTTMIRVLSVKSKPVSSNDNYAYRQLCSVPTQ